MKQKILAAALALAMLFALLPAAAWAEDLPAAGEPTLQIEQVQAEPNPTQDTPIAEPAPEQPTAEPVPNEQPSPEGEEGVPSGDVETTPPTYTYTCKVGDGKECPVPDTTPADAPYFYEAQNIFLANGHPVTVSEGNGKTVISWDGGSKEVPAAVSIFGGCHNYTGGTYDTSITMTGGTVRNLIGGGLHRGTVGTATVKMQGGKVTEGVQGGGASFFSKLPGESYTRAEWLADQTGSKCRTDNAVVEMTGGTATNLFGGGESYAYVGNATVTMTGGTCAELIAGGSNGYVGSATVTLDGGSVTGYLHTVNRGTVNNAELKLQSGTTAALYYGWNKGDQGSSGATSLTDGGGVRTALTVSYKGASVTGSIDKISGIYKDAKVTELKTNTATPEAVDPDASDAEKQAKVDDAVKKAVTDASAPAKSGSTIITTTLSNNNTATALLKNPAMTDPEAGFAELVKGMQDVGNADTTLVLSKNISAVNTDGDGKLTSLVFDVAPIQVSDGSAVRLGSLTAPLTFKLPLPADWATPYASVRHTHGGTVTASEATVRTTEDGAKYIELVTNTFSPFEVAPLAALTPAPTPVPQPGNTSGGSGGGSAKTAVVSLLDSTPKTGPGAVLPALLLAACGLAGLGVLSLRRKEQ